MRVISVYGDSGTGKTSTIAAIIPVLKDKGFSVGYLKLTHHKNVEPDKEGKDTYIARHSGADVSGLHKGNGYAIFADTKKSVLDVLRYFTATDIVFVEGNANLAVPKILTAGDEADIENKLDSLVFMISGKVSNILRTFKGIPVINALHSPSDFVELLLRKSFVFLPQIDCEECGFTCKGLAERILRGEKTIKDCKILSESSVILRIGGKRVDIHGFIQKMFGNMITGAVSALKGYEKGKEIDIKILPGFYNNEKH